MDMNKEEKKNIIPFKAITDLSQGLKLILKLLKNARPYWIPLSIALIFMGADIFFNVAIAWVQQFFIDTINQNRLELLIYYVRISAIVSAFSFIFMMSGYIIRTLISFFTERDLAYKMVDHMNSLSFVTIQNIHSGEIASRINNDAYFSTNFIMGSFYTILVNIGTFLLAFFYLSRINLQLSLLALLSGPIVFAVGRFFDSRLRNMSKSIYQYRAELRGKLQEILQGMETIRTFNLESVFYDKYRETIDRFTSAKKRHSLYSAVMFQTILFTNLTIQIICVYLVSRAAINDSVSIGAVLAFFILMNRLQWPFMNLSQSWGTIQQGFAATERVFDFLSLERETAVMDADIESIDNSGEIYSDLGGNKKVDTILEFRDVYFSHYSEEDEKKEAEINGSDLDQNELDYAELVHEDREQRVIMDGSPRAESGQRPLLFSGINFTVKRGEIVALVGSSGAGKSTIARLACGLYYPDSGEVKIASMSTKDHLHKVRSLISYVPQSPFLFTGTIRENIAYGKTSATEEEIIKAAEAANAHDFIMELPENYDSQVGEHGSFLSGGERQRISIARAFIRNAPLLILDEATSSLDNQSEKMVQESMEKLMNERTSLVIAHRLSTIKNADRIIVLDRGEIVEEGIHDELLGLNGIYASFYRHQFK